MISFFHNLIKVVINIELTGQKIAISKMQHQNSSIVKKNFAALVPMR